MDPDNEVDPSGYTPAIGSAPQGSPRPPSQVTPQEGSGYSEEGGYTEVYKTEQNEQSQQSEQPQQNQQYQGDRYSQQYSQDARYSQQYPPQDARYSQQYPPQDPRYSQQYAQQDPRYSQQYSEQDQQRYSQQQYSQQQYPQQNYFQPQQNYPQPGYPNANVEEGHYQLHEDDEPIERLPLEEQIKRVPSHLKAALIKPNVDAFKRLARLAAWPITFIMLAFSIVWAMLISIISYYTAYNSGTLGAVIAATIFGFVLLFLVECAIMHLVAHLMSSDKNHLTKHIFTQLCFLFSILEVAYCFANLLSIIPILGWIVSIAAFIYIIYLKLLILQALYGVTMCQAVGIFIVYLIALVIIIIVLAVTVASSVVAAIIRAG